MSYSKLRGKIREVFGTQEAFATAMGMNTATISGKLNDKSDWTRAEMELACSLLKIPMLEMHEYFFCPISCENAI
nr:MAG TPA: Protein of unknown function (DUF739) [Caudoviricetes sp.]